MNEPMSDGQHKHSQERASIVVDDACLRELADHLRSGQCDKLKPPIPQDANIPVQFIIEDDDTGAMSVLCGLCKKRVGTNTLKKVIRK